MTAYSNPHHLVMGTLTDFLTRQTLPDTHDERYRQKIARLLVETAGYSAKDIISRIPVTVRAGTRKAVVKVDYMVNFSGHNVMMLRYAPGSLVTRRLSTLALSRIVSDCQIPYVVMTNGETAEILDGDSGKVLASGLEQLPHRKTILNQMHAFSFKPIDSALREKAFRIAYACEVDDACPCDTDICVLDD